MFVESWIVRWETSVNDNFPRFLKGRHSCGRQSFHVVTERWKPEWIVFCKIVSTASSQSFLKSVLHSGLMTLKVSKNGTNMYDIRYDGQVSFLIWSNFSCIIYFYSPWNYHKTIWYFRGNRSYVIWLNLPSISSKI